MTECKRFERRIAIMTMWSAVQSDRGAAAHNPQHGFYIVKHPQPRSSGHPLVAIMKGWSRNCFYKLLFADFGKVP